MISYMKLTLKLIAESKYSGNVMVATVRLHPSNNVYITIRENRAKKQKAFCCCCYSSV